MAPRGRVPEGAGGGETHLGGSVVEDREGGEIGKRSGVSRLLLWQILLSKIGSLLQLVLQKGSEVSGGVSGRAVGSRGELGSSGEPGRPS